MREKERIALAISIISLLAAGALVFAVGGSSETSPDKNISQGSNDTGIREESQNDSVPAGGSRTDAPDVQEAGSETPEERIIGHSVENRPIRAHTVGTGARSIVLIGGIHGGYEWNSVRLAQLLLGHLRNNPDEIPHGYRVSVIPVMNPDGLARVTGGTSITETDFSNRNTIPGRFNANGVDLNRNWDVRWQPTSYWGNREVDAGSEPFSEPETRAVRDFILEQDPAAVIFFQSAANGIWYGGKHVGYPPAKRLAEAYSGASGYPLPEGTEGPVDYEITGAASSYLYTQEIPALTIELRTHSSPEFDRNLRGLRAVFDRLE